MLSNAEYGTCCLFNLATGSIHVKHLIQQDAHCMDLIICHIASMLKTGSRLGVIKKDEACCLQVPFTKGVKLRVSVYKHEDSPFLNPGDLAMRIDGHAMGGSENITASIYNIENVTGASNFAEWTAVICIAEQQLTILILYDVMTYLQKVISRARL